MGSVSNCQKEFLMSKDIQLAGKLLDLDSKYKMNEIITGAGGSMERERKARAAARRAQEEVI